MGLRIKELREAKGLTQEQLADRIGTNAGYLSRMETGKRQTNTKWLGRIAFELGCTVSDLVGKVSSRARSFEVQTIVVRGRVQAGVWAPSYELGADDQYEIEAPKISGNKRSFALEVAGPSMNLVIADGSIIVCVPVQDTADLQADDYVICERWRHDGTVEATIKELQPDAEGNLWLWPRSTDPAHQAPIPLDPAKWPTIDSHEIAEIRITAIVEGAFQRLSRRFRPAK